MTIPTFSDLDPPTRILLGPGPGMTHPRVTRALSAPTLGHLDPVLLKIYSEEQELLRYVFQTKNEWTFALSGTGTSGMESALTNLIEPNDLVLACVHGYFGARLAEIAERLGASVDRIEKPLGQIFSIEEIESALKKKKYKLMTIVQAETSTGAEQLHIQEIAEAAHKNGALIVLDTVTSLGGIPVRIDEWDIDMAYSASQKNLGAPSGLAPITVGPRAREVIKKRAIPVPSFYLDLKQYANYWGGAHGYHHTASASLHFGLREGLRVIAEEGLDHTFARLRSNAEILWNGLEEMDTPPFIPIEFRLPPLTTAKVPAGCDPHYVRARLLAEYNIEIAAGFGALKDRVWRIGLMGYSSRKENITLFLAALRELLKENGQRA
ncbi:MAG TPA: alanine--glyoxylate aminotransferase family protein [Anaerolineales bacterium]|nr:alanine--glyoxylate aminotransferase family protein [Anaerolineales bacterium]